MNGCVPATQNKTNKKASDDLLLCETTFESKTEIEIIERERESSALNNGQITAKKKRRKIFVCNGISFLVG